MVDDGQWQELVSQAQAATQAAYAPYSNFRVGAALLTEDRLIVVGCNVENASYGLTICAERNAIFHAVALSGGQKPAIVALAVATDPEGPGAPCGACRQVMAEFGLDALVSFVSESGRVVVPVRELLPHTFHL
jgi:cytidine deaminase